MLVCDQSFSLQGCLRWPPERLAQERGYPCGRASSDVNRFAADSCVEVSDQAEPNDLLPHGPQCGSAASLRWLAEAARCPPRWLLKAPALLGRTSCKSVDLTPAGNMFLNTGNTGTSKADEEQEAAGRVKTWCTVSGLAGGSGMLPCCHAAKRKAKAANGRVAEGLGSLMLVLLLSVATRIACQVLRRVHVGRGIGVGS